MKKKDCTIRVAMAKLIRVLLFTYAKKRFSHNKAHLVNSTGRDFGISLVNTTVRELEQESRNPCEEVRKFVLF